MEWQPIETAPRDGTWILVYVNGTVTNAFFYLGHWDDGDYFSRMEPTHWMPLPEPPDEE